MPKGVGKKSAAGRALSSRLREKKEEEERENFPAGMRIMVVDDCHCSLTKLMLDKCNHEGAISNRLSSVARKETSLCSFCDTIEI